MPGDSLDALDEQEAWEVVVDALFDEIMQHVEERHATTAEKLRERMHARGDYARGDTARARFKQLARRLDARGFAIARTR
jgi:hypothetical protein